MNPSFFNRGLCLFILFWSLCLPYLSVAQSRQELEQKKKQLTEDIEYKNKLLNETKENQKASLNQLVILKNKITKREQLINTISREISVLSAEIDETNSLIRSLESDLNRYKEEYAALIYNTFKSRNDYEKIMFIFASEDLNQAYRRMKYLQQYAQYRQSQAELIKRTQEQLSDKKEKLETQKQEKEDLLSQQKQEQNNLYTEKSLQNDVYKNLKTKEQQLKEQIQQKQEEAERLKKAIQKIIEEELKRQAEAKKKSGYALTPEARALSAEFEQNKGKLPWPVEKGVITDRYGEHHHPVLKEVKVQNNGLNIGTTKGAAARAVFNGEVSGVVVFQGAGKAILVRHGAFVTVYSNLSEVYVQKGDKVEVKQKLGMIITDEAKGSTEVHFELWKGRETQNPAYWLYNAQ